MYGNGKVLEQATLESDMPKLGLRIEQFETTSQIQVSIQIRIKDSISIHYYISNS